MEHGRGNREGRPLYRRHQRDQGARRSPRGLQERRDRPAAYRPEDRVPKFQNQDALDLMQPVDCNGPRQAGARRAGIAIAALILCGAPTSTSWAQQLTLEVKDYATFPITGSATKSSNNVAGLLARINFLRDEPGGGTRFFVNDLNGPLYILDKQTKKITTYLNFNGRDGQGGLFHKFRF